MCTLTLTGSGGSGGVYTLVAMAPRDEMSIKTFACASAEWKEESGTKAATSWVCSEVLVMFLLSESSSRVSSSLEEKQQVG